MICAIKKKKKKKKKVSKLFIYIYMAVSREVSRYLTKKKLFLRNYLQPSLNLPPLPPKQKKKEKNYIVPLRHNLIVWCGSPGGLMGDLARLEEYPVHLVGGIIGGRNLASGE